MSKELKKYRIDYKYEGENKIYSLLVKSYDKERARTAFLSINDGFEIISIKYYGLYKAK